MIPALGLAGSVVLYLRFEAARSLCRILGLAAPVLAGLFLFTAPIVNFTFAASSEVPKPKVGSRTPVVLIVLDELPLAGLLDSDGKIDARRFPNFAALQRQSDWFRNAVTVADSTEQAVPAILSGNLPDPDGVAIYTDHPENLFTLLGSSLQADISESGTYLCPPQTCPTHSALTDRLWPALGTGLSTANDSFPFGLADSAARELNRRYPLSNAPNRQVKRFLASIKAPRGRLAERDSRRATPYSLALHAFGAHLCDRAPPLGVSTELWSRSPGYPSRGYSG